MRTSTIAIVIVLVMVVLGAVWYFTQSQRGTSAAITNFDECVAAGYPILEKVPPECKTPDGKTFIQFVQEKDSERAVVPSKIETVSVDSGMQENRGTEPKVAFRQTVRSPGAPWIRILFSEFNLGKASFVTVTSLADKDSQRLTGANVAEWSNGTAFFNGDAAEITLTVAPGESGIFFRVKEIVAGVVADVPAPTGSEE